MPVTLVATYAAAVLSLTLHYPMTCGRPGPGPLVVQLPPAFVVSRLRVRVGGAVRPARVSGARLTISLPTPPEVTCMSIAEGTLRVSVVRVRAPAGGYTLHARLPKFAFAARLRVR